VAIRAARLPDAAAVGEALAEAFDDYPWTRWVAGEERRRERMARLYRLWSGIAGAETGATWLAEEDGEVLAVASWVRPGVAPSAETTTLLDREQPALLGDRAAVVAAADTAVAMLRPPPPHRLLAALGTRPAARGRGLARALIAEGLRAADADGLPAVLDTSSTDNVRFYESCGFAVAGELDPPGGAPHVWVMVRPAGAPQPS
jgi:ribosomal protein S18 acetylase RimI-like enzyme